MGRELAVICIELIQAVSGGDELHRQPPAHTQVEEVQDVADAADALGSYHCYGRVVDRATD